MRVLVCDPMDQIQHITILSFNFVVRNTLNSSTANIIMFCLAPAYPNRSSIPSNKSTH